MPTVNFLCGHCQKPMAVTDNFLGQQVRCPHCQGVVMAPPPPSAAPVAVPAPEAPPAPVAVLAPELPVPVFTAPSAAEQESIFEPIENSSEDLFGAPTAKVEMPQDGPPSWMRPPAEWAAPPPPTPGEALSLGGLQPTESVMLPESLPSAIPNLSLDEPTTPASPPATDWMTAAPPAPAAASDWLNDAAPAPAAANDWMGATTAAAVEAPAPVAVAPVGEPEAEPVAVPVPSSRKPAPKPKGYFIPLVMAPLISYAVLATILVLLLYFGRQPHPLEVLPDLDGEHHRDTGRIDRPATPKKTTALPSNLLLRLGETRTFGDLQVTPVKIEQRHIQFSSERPNTQTERSGHETLVLTLRLRNVSSDITFHPTDAWFERRWELTRKEGGPYLSLMADDKLVCVGGAVDWRHREQNRDFVVGANYGRLDPGKEMTTAVSLDPDDKPGVKLAKQEGPLTWRVQLRRGSVRVGGWFGGGKRVAAAMVIGVRFDKSEVKRTGGA